jgi:hypothetical protein
VIPFSEGTAADVARKIPNTAVKLENVLMLGDFDVILACKKHLAILHHRKIL